MLIKELYKTIYTGDDGQTIVSIGPVLIENNINKELVGNRVIADEGKCLSNGETKVRVLDIKSLGGWEEIDLGEEEEYISYIDLLNERSTEIQ